MKLILIVEDDISIANLIRTYIEMAGFECTIATDGECAIQMLTEESYSLILLDLMLPKISGEKVLQLVKDSGIPVIVLSAKSTLSERVKLLRAGADDYITKPFESADLIARIEAVLRRYEKIVPKLCFKDVEINKEKYQVTKNLEIVDLTPREYQLLVYLIANKNRVIPKIDILNAIWGVGHTGETRTLDVHIQRIRKKLCFESEIRTINKVGYILEE